MSGRDTIGTTFLDVFDMFVINTPSKTALSFLDDYGDVATSLTYQRLADSSKVLAAHMLSKLKLKKGDRVVLVYPPSLDFLVSFIACLRIGVIAVPVFPPDPSKLNKVKNCGAKVALTSSLYDKTCKLATIASTLSAAKVSWPDALQWTITDTIISSTGIGSSAAASGIGLAQPVFDSSASPNDIAFLQYTSGSTSEPKGVKITQGNLYHNLKLIITGLSATDDTVVVSWLPQYHDMGLVGSYLGALFCGGEGFYMAPHTYIRNPALWMRCISKYKATHMQAPNFAYALTARKFIIQSRGGGGAAANAELDLSSVRHMINAAEPVEAAAIDLFYAVFEKFKLKRGVIFPTYGLAEHTVYVCSNGKLVLTVDKEALEKDRIVRIIESQKSVTEKTEKEKDSSREMRIVGCGKPTESKGLTLKIVETDGLNPLPEGRVGEVWLKSPSCANGYWNLEDKSVEDFQAALSQDLGEGSIAGGGEGGFLRTGDLGFLHQGELFICGRVKDLIIIRGRNHYPQDIERTGEAADGGGLLRRGCSAAFSIPIMGQELLVYSAELAEGFVDSGKESLQKLIETIIVEVSHAHGVSLSAVALLRPRTIPKTTSGKIARQWVRKAYLEGKLNEIHTWSSLDSSNHIDDMFEEKIASGSIPNPNITREDDAMDPLGKKMADVLPILQRAVATCIDSNRPERIATNLPLVAVGMDSMSGIQLQAILERKFTVQLPEELLFEPDATLQTIASALISGGLLKQRPMMVNAWEAISQVRKVAREGRGKAPSGPLPQVWFKEHSIRAHVDTHLFPDGIARIQAPMTAAQEWYYIFNALMLFGTFVFTPFAIAALLLYFPAHIAVAFAAAWFGGCYLFPAQRWPPALRLSFVFECVCRYFSYRVIIEKKIDFNAAPTIYAFGPHGVFALAPTIQAMVSEFIMGNNFHVLGANVIFYIPGYNVILRMLSFKTIDETSFVGTLKSGRAVGIVPGGIAEMFSSTITADKSGNEVMAVRRRKGFVRIALQQGAQIVPCYCYGNSKIFHCYSNDFLATLSRKLRMSLLMFFGRWGLPIPNRTELLTVIGRPIQCPKIDNPSLEMINEYHQIYLNETKRIFNRYKNSYGWSDKGIEFVN